MIKFTLWFVQHHASRSQDRGAPLLEGISMRRRSWKTRRSTISRQANYSTAQLCCFETSANTLGRAIAGDEAAKRLATYHMA